MSPIMSPSTTLPDLVMDEPSGVINDFSDLFDFDSAADESHSTTTISPNHTPSPVLAASRSPAIARSPTPPSFPLGPAPGDVDMQIKQEPMDYFPISFDQPEPLMQATNEASTSAVPVPVDMSFSTFPKDQQEALQQLMLNLFEYQKNFGPMDTGVPAPASAQQVQQEQQPMTIEPSLVFSTSPTTSFSSSSASASGSGSATRSYVSPMPMSLAGINEEEEEDEPLNTVGPLDIPPNAATATATAGAGPSRSRPRQTSVFSSNDDLDSKLDRLAPRDSIFSAGKGKGGKKGGGLSSVVRGDDENLDEDDSWRPSPEEYKKLSSKEKRQLRNKLSARAFRTRRKDYIGTLEGHIKDRDDVIDEMRSELMHSRTENQDLRRELEALKSSTMKILHPESASTTSQSPALFTGLALPTHSPITRATPTPTPTFNPNKDMPMSSASTQASRGFWGAGNGASGGGGSTICHHTFTPPPVFPRASANINPLLNSSSSSTPQSSFSQEKDLSQPFSDWSADNTFNLRSMDAYRMQMWSRLTREAQAEKDQVPFELRPKFYADPSSSSSSASASSSSASATSSTSAGASEATAAAAAAVAATAASHITSKLASSFWSAFSGPSSSLDTDKLAAVVTGTAKLAVVPDSHPHSPSGSAASSSSDESLSYLMGGLKLHSGPAMTMPINSNKVRENPLGALSSFLKHAASGVPARA